MSDRPGEGYPYRFNEIVKRLLGGKGGEPLNEVAGDLVTSIVLEGPDAPFEYRRLGGIASWGVSRNAGANVGVFTQLGVRLQPSVGLITVVEGFSVKNTNAVAIGVQVRVATGVLPGIIGSTVSIHRDTHLLTTASIGPATLMTEIQNAALQGFPFLTFSLAAANALGDSAFFPTGPLIELAPGGWLLANPIIVNQNIEMSAWGYERVEEPSEVTAR